MFESADKLLLGLLTGVLFGFLLQKGRVAKFRTIVGQFLLKDWTVVKVMATAVVVGAIGVYTLVELGLATLHVKPALLGGVILGGVFFGMGMVVLGYCPGTAVAAVGEGRRDALVGVAGMLAGATLYVVLYPVLKPIMGLGDLGKVTIPEWTGTSPWLWIVGLAILTGGLFWMLERGRRQQPMPAGNAEATEQELVHSAGV